MSLTADTIDSSSGYAASVKADGHLFVLRLDHSMLLAARSIDRPTSGPAMAAITPCILSVEAAARVSSGVGARVPPGMD